MVADHAEGECDRIGVGAGRVEGLRLRFRYDRDGVLRNAVGIVTGVGRIRGLRLCVVTGAWLVASFGGIGLLGCLAAEKHAYQKHQCQQQC